MQNLTNFLNYKDNQLYFKELDLSVLIKHHKTPFYLYSEEILLNNFKQYANYLSDNSINGLICFALKSNNNLELLSSLAKEGCGADIVSGLELKRALAAGIKSKSIVFSGVGKTKEDIELGIESDILSFNVESIEELQMINSIAKTFMKTVDVAFRLNPKVHAKTHKHISTGFKTHKFGILKEDIKECLGNKELWTNVNLIGLSVHIGSQLTDLEATELAVHEVCKLAKEIKVDLKFLDLGGGLGVNYNKEKDQAPSIEEYLTRVTKITNTYFKDIQLIFEPGRSISASAGFFLSRVIRNKTSDGNHFLIVDGGMNDFVRPSLYDAYHEIYPSKQSLEKRETDIVGPICETADCFGEKRSLPVLKENDYILIADTGAYGFTMSSTYNMRTRPQELIIKRNLEITVS